MYLFIINKAELQKRVVVFIGNPQMKFQNPIMHDSKDVGRTNHKQYVSSTFSEFFKAEGIETVIQEVLFGLRFDIPVNSYGQLT